MEPPASPAPAATRAQLAQLEKQLSEWIDCASAKTQAGRDKISEISSKIDAIKGAMQQEVAQGSQSIDALSTLSPAALRAPLRLDGTGAWISVKA